MSTNNIILYNPENYNSSFVTKDSQIYFIKYLELLNEFLLHISENIVVQDNEYQLFIMKRGIDTLRHIYTTLLMYTRNLELTTHHVQKSYCYYVEFISQISDENHSFLKLNSKDATLFVYKKTIFDINQEYRKTFDVEIDETEMLLSLNHNIKCYNDFVIYILQKNNAVLSEELNETISISDVKSTVFVIKYGSVIGRYIFEITSNEEAYKDLFKILSNATYYLCKYNITSTKITAILQTLFKKYINKLAKNSTPDTLHDSMDRKLMSDQMNERIYFTPIKIVNWLLE